MKGYVADGHRNSRRSADAGGQLRWKPPTGCRNSGAAKS